MSKREMGDSEAMADIVSAVGPDAIGPRDFGAHVMLDISTEPADKTWVPMHPECPTRDLFLSREQAASLHHTLGAILARDKSPTYRPVGEWVIVKRQKAHEQRGTLLVPEVAQEVNVNRGTVLALGQGYVLGPPSEPAMAPNGKWGDGAVIPFGFKVGDVVHWMAYAGEAVKLEPDGDVFAVLGRWVSVVEEG